MLRYIGLFLALAGASLLVATLIRGRQKGIKTDSDELAMIISSGYVSERTPDKKKSSPFEGQLPIKQAPKKKRVLSEEARSILEQVENDRARQAEAEKISSSSKKGTDTLPANKKRSTAILPEKPSKGTTEPKTKTGKSKGTAVLREGAEKKKTAGEHKYQKNMKEGTAVLESRPATEQKGTAILEEAKAERGTAVLADKGTAALHKGTAVLADKGTAVLATDEKDRRKGTEILTEQEV